MTRRSRIFACAAFAAAITPGAVPAFAVQSAAAPSALVFHAFRPHETIKRTLVHDSAGPDGPTTFHGVAETVVDSVSDDTVVARVTVSGSGIQSFGDEYRLDRRTLHLHDRSGTDTSATTSSFFNPVLYGVPVDPLSVGKTWQTSINTWLYGPAGTSTVRVAALDRTKRTLRLELTGSGTGMLGNDLKNPQNLLVTVNGKSTYHVKREDGRSDWHGYVELADGIVQHSVLVMQTHILTPSTPESPKRNDVETVTLESTLLELHR